MNRLRIATIGIGAALVTALLAGTSPTRAEPRMFQLDPEHTGITFFVNHLGFSDTAGMFLESEGSFVYDEDTQALSDLEVVVKTESVFTGHERRDEHLRNADFLNVEAFPEMTFVGTSVEPLGENEGTVTGDFTLLGVTRPVTFEVRLNKTGQYPFGDEHYALGVDAIGTIQRSDFGMTYAVDPPLVGDEIEIRIGLEAIRVEE